MRNANLSILNLKPIQNIVKGVPKPLFMLTSHLPHFGSYQIFDFGKNHAIGFSDIFDHCPAIWIIEKRGGVAQHLLLHFDHTHTHHQRLALTCNVIGPNLVDEINFFIADQTISYPCLQCEQPLEYLGASRKGKGAGN